MVKNTKDYIDKEEFYKEMLLYVETKQASDNLAKMLCLLAKNISHSSYFRGYNDADLEDMRSDAVIACLSALPKYETSRENPFAYFTRVVLNAFKYYLKRKYKVDNFRMDLIEDVYIQNNKPFVNEIKKDYMKNNKDKSLKIEIED
jgi:DNA-directed RNA polymerase specialized sigma subunit